MKQWLLGNKQFIILAVIFSLVGTGAAFALPYIPQDAELNPLCAPGDNNCYVSIDTLPTQTGNAGKFLTTNGTTASWSSVASGVAIGDIIGSATAGSILFTDSFGNLAQDNTNFFWDEANNRLGIGTNSPSSKLSIVGSTEHTSLETGALIRLYSSGAGIAGYIGATGNAGITIQSTIPGSQNYYLSLNPYGGDIGIGIGDNSPDAAVEIGPIYSGSGTRRSFQISESYATTNLTATYTSVYLNPTINQTGVASGVVTGFDYNPILTSIQGAHYAALFRSGNVGIGDATPIALFTVGNGDLFQVNSFGSIAAATGITSSGTINFSGLTASKVIFTDASKNLTSIGVVGVDQGGTGLTSIGAANQILGVNNTGTGLEYKTVSVNAVAISNDVGVTLSGANAIVINLPTATLNTRGVLSNSDWGIFNAKENALTFSTGLTRSTNTITVDLSTGISGGQSVIGGIAASENLTLSSTSDATKGKILFGTSAYDELNNRLGIGTAIPGSKMDVATGTLTGSDKGFNLSGTLTPTSGSVYGQLISMNTSGSASGIFMAGLRVITNNGYTGSSANSAASLYNNVSGTGILNAFTVSNSTPLGNSGFVGFAGASTTGTNYGGYNEALNGNINIGVTGKANFAKNSAVNIGVLGIGRNTGTTPTQIGGWFSLGNATPTWESAALVADNGDQTSPIFLGKDNGTTRFAINDGGTVAMTLGALPSGVNGLNMTATLNASTLERAVFLDITTAGSSSSLQSGFSVIMNAGYTGSNNVSSGVFETLSASTGNNLRWGQTIANVFGNAGVNAFAYGTTTGLNIGGRYGAQGGNLNVGIAGVAVNAKSGSTNIGVIANGRNVGGTNQIGLLATLSDVAPTYESAALISDNSDQTSPIALFKDNGTTVFAINDGGGITHTLGSLTGSSTTSALSIAQTWNTTGAPTAFNLNITDTASSGSSLFAEFSLAGSSRFRMRKDGRMQFGSSGSGGSVGPTNNGTTINASGVGLLFNGGATSTDYPIYSFTANNSTLTSGSSGVMQIYNNFQPTSGTGVYNFLTITPTVNQTGGANGITRGIYVNPTVTSAADFRAIETTTGKIVFGGVGAFGVSDDYLCISATNVLTRGASCGTSSQRFKHNIQNYQDSLTKVLQLRPVSFTYNESNKDEVGFIAEEVNQIEPLLVIYEDDGTTPKSLKYPQFTTLLVGAIQEINANFTSLDASKQGTLGYLITEFLRNTAAFIKGVKTDRVETKELCVGSVCVTESQFLNMVQSSGVSNAPNNNSTLGEEDPEYEPEVAPLDEELDPPENTDNDDSDSEGLEETSEIEAVEQ